MTSPSVIKMISEMNRVIVFLLSCLAAGSLHATQLGAFDLWDGFRMDAKPGDQQWLAASPYTLHFTKSDEHRTVFGLGLERQRESGQITGLGLFRNSFGQPTAYLYPWGQKFDFASLPGSYFKVTGGVLWGYRGEYRDKIPLNRLGVAPAVIFTLGHQVGPYRAGLNLLGNSGVMLEFSRRL